MSATIRLRILASRPEPKAENMPREIARSYSHQQVEGGWYERWAEAAHFAPGSPGAPSFSMVIPPPNVTGSLHMGHALNNTLQDVLCRFHRMDGRNVLWVPGTDHAGIATQNVVERQLAAEGQDRADLGREAFIERVWEWREETGGTILKQLRALGVSCDWSRERFTMDEGLSRAVREAFVRLSEEGLLYRAERLINWCPRCKTALADIEVVHEEVDGHLWHVRYPLVEGASWWWPPRVPRPCWATPASRSTPTTNATPAASGGAPGCRWRTAISRWWRTPSSIPSSAPARSRSPPGTTSTTSKSA